MEGDRGKYTKDPVKVRFTTKADGRKSISFEIYQNGKRTYERLPNLFLLVETDDNSIRKNRATLNKVEKLRKALVREHYEVHYIILRASKEETLKRAVERSKLDRKTNIELVETMWEQFCNLGIYESNVVDTTNYSIQETVSAVQEKIASRAALLS